MATVSREEIFGLLQNQAELTGLLREPIRNEKDLLKAKEDLSRHNDFINQIGRVSTKLQLPLEIVFQCLMYMSTFILDHAGASASKNNGAPADFDRQHRQGNVPMHQAKVLKREGLAEIQPKLEAAVPSDKLNEMIHFSSSLRSLVRMKVEDGNDLSMARKAISYADDYMLRIFNFSKGNTQLMWKMYNAVDDRELASLICGGGGSSDQHGNSNNNGLAGSSSSSLDSNAMTTTFGALGGTMSNFQGTIAALPPPHQLMSSIESICKKSLMSATVVVGERQSALANLESWFRSMSLIKSEDEDDDDGEDGEDNDDDQEDHENSAISSKSKQQQFTVDLLRSIFSSVSFRKGIAIHVGEKRSALCRAACDIVSILLQNVTELDFIYSASGMTEMRESLVAWLEVLLKQVHVTVAAIATATDACVRDMFVATGGHISLMNMTSQVAAAASQPELQRKCMGYLALGVVSHLHMFDVSEVDPAAKCSVIAVAAAKLLKSSTEVVRRAARVAGTISQRVHPSIGIQGWDDRVEKAASAEAYLVASAAEAGTLEFECSALRYPEPCPVSQHCANKHACAISLTGDNHNQNNNNNSNNNNTSSSNNTFRQSAVLSASASSFSGMSSTTSSASSSSFSKTTNAQQQQQQQQQQPLLSVNSFSSVSTASSANINHPKSASSSSTRLDNLALPKVAQQQQQQQQQQEQRHRVPITSNNNNTSGSTRVPLSSAMNNFYHHGNSAHHTPSSGSAPHNTSSTSSSSSSFGSAPIKKSGFSSSSSSSLSSMPSSSVVTNTTTTSTASQLASHIAQQRRQASTANQQQQQQQPSTTMPLSLGNFQNPNHHHQSSFTTTTTMMSAAATVNSHHQHRGREPASPNTEATVYRGSVTPSNSAAQQQQVMMSETLRRKVHAASNGHQF